MIALHENFSLWKAQLGRQAIAQSLRKQTALFPHWQLRKQAVALSKLMYVRFRTSNKELCWSKLTRYQA